MLVKDIAISVAKDAVELDVLHTIYYLVMLVKSR